MTHAEVLEVIGMMFGAYFMGWCCGATFLFFKQFIEKI